MALYMIEFAHFVNMVDELTADGHIRYDLGAKPSLKQDPDKIYKSDCSGFVRYFLYRVSGGRIDCSPTGGTWHQNQWCRNLKLTPVNYDTAAYADSYLRIAFINGGKNAIGHVWLIHAGKTIESCSSSGGSRRAWDTKVLKNNVDACYKIALLTVYRNIQPQTTSYV